MPRRLAGVPFQAEALAASMLVQAGLSLVWTLCALGLTIVGTRLGRRDLWMVGAALVGVVVVKLFFVELGSSGSLERIISFIGVGVLLLVVGYFSPCLPRRAEVASGRAAMTRSFSFRTAGLLLLGACLSLPLSAKESAEGFSRQVALSLRGKVPGIA